MLDFLVLGCVVRGVYDIRGLVPIQWLDSTTQATKLNKIYRPQMPRDTMDF